MKKLVSILLVGMISILCACSNRNEQDQPSDITAGLEKAQTLYDHEEYADSLETYLQIMQENPKDMESRIGTVKCQIALENYNMALMNLSAAILLEPQTEELYELYLEISDKTNNLSAARTAVTYAKRYGVSEFLEKVPSKPVLNYEGGYYDQKIFVTAEAEEEDVQIFVTVNKDNMNYYNVEYAAQWPITNGVTKLSAYCVRDGIPSETVEATYVCDYEPTIVQFEDPVMEQLVRNTIQKPQGEITDTDCEAVTSLNSYQLRADGMSYDEYANIKLHSLGDLQFFPNLQSIYLYGQSEVTDFSELGNCTLLTTISVQNCQLESVDQIIMHKNLQSLDVSGNPISDVSKLADLEQLYYLRFDASQTKDFNWLKDFKSLGSLSVVRSGDEDISAIGNLTDLNSLTIEYDWSSDEYYNRSYLSDISFVSNLTNLTYLYISCLEDLSQAECLKSLRNLQNLYLYNRKNYDSDQDEKVIADLQQALPNCSIQY